MSKGRFHGLAAEFGDSGDAGPAAMRCLRKKDHVRQRHELMTFFGPVCSEDYDLAAFQDPNYQVLLFRVLMASLQLLTAAAACSRSYIGTGWPLEVCNLEGSTVFYSFHPSRHVN